MNKKLWNVFYLDKEKDIKVNLYKNKDDELNYVIETPNHKNGNLITNFARVCDLSLSKGENGAEVIKGTILASLNGDNREVYILRLNGTKVANIYADGVIDIRAKVPAISKVLMSQTKRYDYPIEKTLVKTYILKKYKFRTDLHTHMNANLPTDALIALGLKYQMRYSYYFIRKLGLKITDAQREKLEYYKAIIYNRYKDCGLQGKAFERKVMDETYINFADLIFNNLENANENIIKIRNSLTLVKEGQCVFTNLEKLYVYRYVFCKGRESEIKVKYGKRDVSKIPSKGVRNYLYQMLEDVKPGSKYRKNTILQDKLLWIAREYKKQGIELAEISTTDLAKKGDAGINYLKQIHDIMPKIEKETGVSLRFLVAIRRIWFTPKQIMEAFDVAKVMSLSPYVVGTDIIGEEVNSIREFKDLIAEMVEFATEKDKDFTIQIHAGENDSFSNNVYDSIKCVKEALIAKAIREGKSVDKLVYPKVRIGHGLYSNNDNEVDKRRLLDIMKESGAIIEFQLSSNVRLNNLTDLENHPIKQYLDYGVNCVQGTDGCGMYGTDTFEEQLALKNLLNVSDEQFEKMRKVEDKVIAGRKEYFKRQTKAFKEMIKGETLENVILKLEEKAFEERKLKKTKIYLKNTNNSEKVFNNIIPLLPTDKFPVVIAGGSFNTDGRTTQISEAASNALEELVRRLDEKKVYFVVGSKMQGYEKEVLEISRRLNKKFDVFAIVPNMISDEDIKNLKSEQLSGIRISPETEDPTIYKSFNYEIFERRNSAVIAFDGNTPVTNLIQEAKNGKGKSKIFINLDNKNLKAKAESLSGYVTPFKETFVNDLLEEYPELEDVDEE